MCAVPRIWKKFCRDAYDIGIKYLTVYLFSTENWKRSREEVDGLMKLLFRLNEPRDPKMSERGGVYANLLCAHPPFQMDGNFGYTAGIAELLVQSHADEIVILPALPGHWTKGSVKGLGVRGNVCVDITWDEEKTECTLISSTDQKRTVRIKGGIPKRNQPDSRNRREPGCFTAAPAERRTAWHLQSEYHRRNESRGRQYPPFG